MGHPEMGADPRLETNAGRVEHEEEIDAVIEAWTNSLESGAALDMLEQARVPAGPINSVSDMFADPHFNARGLFEEVDVNGSPLKIPAMIPKMSATPGRTDWAGPGVGAHNREVYGELLGLQEEEIAVLENRRIL